MSVTSKIVERLRRWVKGMAKDELPQELLWLLDAPMFIDEKQVDAFYDAVVRPDYEGASLTLTNAITDGTKFSGGLTVGAAIPWLVKAEGDLHAEAVSGRERGQQRTLTPVSNAYRHLLALSLHYATSEGLDKRLVLADAGARTAQTGGREDLGEGVWKNDEYITSSPRALVFLDLPKKTKFIPTALELTSGEVILLFSRLADALVAPNMVTAPRYPARGSEEERDAYWRWFSEKFDEPEVSADRKALQIVEEAVAEHKIAWIDYRVPLAAGDAPFLHLHIAPRGNYETGVFGYNLISRGFKHGVRIVGTLKSEPDLNVLAIFER